MVLVIATIIFSSAVAVLTFTQSIVISSILFFISLVGVLYRGWKSHKRKIAIYTRCISSIRAVSAVSIYDYWYTKDVALPAQQSIAYTTEGYDYIVSSGTIIEQQTDTRYIWKTSNGVTYFLYTSDSHFPGEIIRLTANMQLATKGGLSLFTDHKKKWNAVGNQLKSGIFDYRMREVMKGVAGTIYEKNSIIVGSTEPESMTAIRHNFQKMIRDTFASKQSRGLVSAMIIGDRSMMTKSEYQSFIDSGIVHIIAVSGGNIIMLVLFLQLILFRVPFYVRIGVIIPCIIIYAMICGLDASIMRATIMAALTLSALFRGRQVVVRRSLVIAFIGMLSINPLFLLYDVGFLLSFSAVIGIVYMSKRTENIHFSKQRIGSVWRFICRTYIFPSLGATIGVTPFLLFFSGKFNIISIIANVFVVPLTPFIMIGGGVVTFLHPLINLSRPIKMIDSIVSWIYIVADGASSYGIYIQSTKPRFMYIFLCIVLILFVRDRIHSFHTIQEKKHPYDHTHI